MIAIDALKLGDLPADSFRNGLKFAVVAGIIDVAVPVVHNQTILSGIVDAGIIKQHFHDSC